MRWMLLALALAACGGKKSPPAAGSGSGSTVAATTADAAPATAPVDAGPPARRTITKELRAEYKQYLNKGRTAAKAAQWPEAIAALNSALAAIPGDDRALAELSFAAMSAGDFDTARKAGRQAVLVATDPKIKAAALYNLGRVEEADAPAKAIELYRQSLALRPSKIVDKRLADISSRVQFTPDPLPCTKPAAPDAVCSCLNQTAEDLEPGRKECTVTTTALADFQVASLKTSEIGEEEVYLLGKSDAGWAVVAVLDTVYNPGAFGISEEWELAEATDQRYGTHSTARFVGHKSRHDSDMGIDEEESEDTTELTVCVRDNAGGLPACPLQVTTGYSYVRDRMGMATDDELAEMADSRTPGLPIRSETKIAVEVGADGVAKIRAISGRPEAATLGDRKLW